MKRVLMVSALAMWAGLNVSTGTSEAQNIRDLTTHEPTRGELVDALKPRSRGLANRGIELATGGTCEVYRQTRGIAPVVEVAAIRVTFAFNSAELAPEAIPTLKNLGEALKELGSSCFRIEGHTDSKGSDAYNLKLSQRRAQSVVRYLTKYMDVEEDRLLAVGKGKSEPIADNSTSEGRQKNRRVQIVNLGYARAVAQESR